jgi:membrane protein implicated in regulation of membrane protease activity
MELYHWTIIALLGCLIVELLTGEFLFLGMAISLVPIGILHATTDEFSFSRDLIILGVGTAIATYALRRAFHHRGDVKSTKGDISKY